MTRNRQEAFGSLDGKPGEGQEIAQDAQQQQTEGQEANDGEVSHDGGESKPKSEPQAPKYTDEDLDNIVKRIIAKERAKAETKVKELTEAQKLEKMSDDERAAYERKQLEDKVAELEREKSLNEQMGVARSELSKAGINIGDGMLSIFVSPEAEKTKAAIDEIKRLWPEAVNKAVQDALKRETPKSHAGGQTVSDGAKFAKQYNQKMIGVKKDGVQ